MHARHCRVAVLFAFLLASCPAWGGAPTFQELMNPKVFPLAQFGMKVDSAVEEGSEVRIRTTGAEILVDGPRGAVILMQRLGHARPLAMLRFGRALDGVKLIHFSPGFAMVTCDNPKLTIRVNGDSLFMLHAEVPVTVAVDRKFRPFWNASYKTDHLLADEWGAIGLYCSDTKLADHFDASAKTVAQYPLPADAVLWAGVCPPKPYPWLSSIFDRVIWHWSRTDAYPPDAILRSWKGYGNIALLQSEMMLWKNWNLGFVPRKGAAEFARVRRTLHRQGMRLMVYTSPAYFLKGTPLASKAINTFQGFKGWPPTTNTGENMDLFLKAITQLMKRYRPDGLYFDGQYSENPAALYALARHARAIVGEHGLLEWHSTTALGKRQCYLPQADAYVNFILRGEGRTDLASNRNYLRYFVSGYNINNCIGVVCNNGPQGLTPQLARAALSVNARFHLLAGWMADPKTMTTWREDYLANLRPALRNTVGHDLKVAEATAPQKAAAASQEWQILESPPQWTQPEIMFNFDTMPIGRPVVSPLDPDAFTNTDGLLSINAHANTYAYLQIPLQLEARGLVVSLRQSTDQGMSWGPGAMLVWPDKSALRLGVRSDGTVQADILGRQYVGGKSTAGQFVYLRARWTEHYGVVEESADGTNFETLWRFEHGGEFLKPTSELLVGKVPYNGQPQDYSYPGPLGSCDIDLVQIFGK